MPEIQEWMREAAEDICEKVDKSVAKYGTCELGAEDYEDVMAAHAPHASADDWQIVKDACDREWKDETPHQIAVIASNAMHWRNEEIRKLRDERAELLSALKEAETALEHWLALVGESKGVAGWHLNGNIAAWSEFDEIEESETVLSHLRAVLPKESE